MSSSTRIIGVLILTIISMILAFKGLDFTEMWHSIQSANLWFFGLVCLGYLFTHSLRTLRLWLLIGGKGTFGSIFSINTIGFLAINVIPLRMGEFVRPYLLLEKENMPFGEAMVAIVLERWLDMCMLLIMLFGLGWFIELPDGVVVNGIDILSVGQKTLGSLVVIGFIGLAILIWFGERLLRPWESHSNAVLSKGIQFFLSLREGAHRLFGNPILAIQAFGISMGVWAATMLSIWFALLGFPDLPNSVGVVWSVWTITLVGMVVAPTPGFIGVYELFCATALWLWGVDRTDGTAFAMALHASQLLFTIALGTIFILKEGVSLSRIVKDSRKDLDSKP